MAHRLDLLYRYGYRRLAHRPDAQLCWVALYPALVCILFALGLCPVLAGLLWLVS